MTTTSQVSTEGNPRIYELKAFPPRQPGDRATEAMVNAIVPGPVRATPKPCKPAPLALPRVQQRMERTFGANTLSTKATLSPRLSPFRSFGG